MGRPAVVKRVLQAEDISELRQSAANYVELLQNYR